MIPGKLYKPKWRMALISEDLQLIDFVEPKDYFIFIEVKSARDLNSARADGPYVFYYKVLTENHFGYLFSSNSFGNNFEESNEH